MVLSQEMWSPQAYLDKMTGKCFVFNSTDNDIEFIENCLINEIGEKLGNDRWSYSLDELEYIVENGIDVVLVEGYIWDEKTERYDSVLRWFEADRELEWD